MQWPGRELNPRHADFQSAALPTELPGRGGGNIRKGSQGPAKGPRTEPNCPPAALTWRPRSGDPDARATFPLFLLSVAAAGAGALALESASRAQAQARNPLLNVREPGPAPEWHNTSWLNTDHAAHAGELKGRVVLLNFWVFTCYNCTNTVPSLVDFDRKYRDQGLTHHRHPHAGVPAVRRASTTRATSSARSGSTASSIPNAQDNDYKTWNLYGIRFWPSFVLIDKKGTIRYEGAGEFHLNDGSYRTWDQRIQELLAE